jgi:hypothetical protein
MEIDNTQTTLITAAGRALRSMSNQSNEPCAVAQYPSKKPGIAAVGREKTKNII